MKSTNNLALYHHVVYSSLVSSDGCFSPLFGELFASSTVGIKQLTVDCDPVAAFSSEKLYYFSSQGCIHYIAWQ